MAPSRIVELSTIIHENTSKIGAYFTQNALPLPSFDVAAPLMLSLPPDIQSLQNSVLEANDELNSLILGPVRFLASQPHNMQISLQAIQRFDIAKAFPIDATISFSELAQICALPESDLIRLLRHAMTFRIFYEPSKGVVAHTAASKALAQLPMLSSLVGFMAGEMWPSATRVVDAMEKWPGSEEPNEAGFALAFHTDHSMMDVVGKDQQRAQRMSMAMSFMHSGPGYLIEHIIKNFDWGDAVNGVFVDVGGSLGPVAIEVARTFPHIRCVVQDLPDVVSGAEVPTDLQHGGRLTFMAHDFFQEQPVTGADVFFLRWVLHDWSDKHAIRILQSLIPALKEGARVLVADLCLPAPGSVSLYKARQARLFDLAMKEIQNGKERDADDWARLFEHADPRFHLQSIQQPQQLNLALISVVWRG